MVLCCSRCNYHWRFIFREESTQKEIQIDGLGFSMILLGFATASIVYVTNWDQMSNFLLMNLQGYDERPNCMWGVSCSSCLYNILPKFCNIHVL